MTRLGQVFNRALTYGVLVTVIGAAYVYGVTNADRWFGLDSDWLALPQVAACFVLALVFHPVRLRLESLADRLVYGRRMTSATAVGGVAALGRGAGDGAANLQELARIVALGLGSGTATVRLDLANGSSLRYAWPADREPTPAAASAAAPKELPITYRGAEVGAFELPATASRVPRRRRALIESLTQSSGVILHNASLTIELERHLEDARDRAAEIRASRWRIVAAQDSERRELERDLHDGAQPGLTAVRLSLGLVTHLAKSGKQDAARKALQALSGQIDGASAGLHQTLRGLDPEVLRESGIAAAVRELAADLGVAQFAEIADETKGLRLRADVEASAYFCCAEALQNAAKHSPGAPVRVTLAHDEALAQLRFEVRDEGPGFDARAQPSGIGSGLQNMCDRAAAVGGALTVTSSPEGTVVAGWVPAILP